MIDKVILHIGDKVTHSTLGDGIVTVVDEEYVTIKFAEEELTFRLPDAFENGFLSLQAPGDWYGGVFPSVPRPLCYRPYYSGSIVVAPYWGVGYVQYGNTNSYMRAGTLVDGTTVVEFHDIKRSQLASEGMTYQVIIPGGTGDVVDDGVEITQLSDPGDAADGGVSNSCVAVTSYFGDWSASCSEK